MIKIVNRSALDEGLVRDVADLSGIAAQSFVLFLDSVVNAVRADSARMKLQEYAAKGWTALAFWEKDLSGENDIHACTVCRRLMPNQSLPSYVIDAIEEYELLVYLDATWTGGHPFGFVLTLAHELRHAWQYFNSPIVFHSQTALSWVVPPQSTPCEIDAEKAGKRVLREIYPDEAVGAYFADERVSGRPEHAEMIENLIALDPAADPDVEARTIQLLEFHAAEIRRLQAEHNFIMPGSPELAVALRGRSAVKLQP